MHELTLANNLMVVIENEAKARGISRVLEIRIRAGTHSGVLPECLRECFTLAAAGSCAEGAALSIETVEAAVHCAGCGYDGPPKGWLCPRCGGEDIRLTAGREFYVESLAVE